MMGTYLGARVLVFDTETTGTDDHDQIIQLAWGWMNQEGSVDSMQSFKCMPTIEWESEWHDEHNLSMKDIEGYPHLDLNVIQPFILALNEAEYILGYNVKFDVNMVSKELRKLGLDSSIIQNKLQIDPMTIWAISEPNKKLETAYRTWKGEELIGAHDALIDVVAAAAILPEMLNEFGLNDLSLEEVVGFCDDAKFVDAEGKMKWEEGKPTLTFGKHVGKSVFAMAWSGDRDERWYAQNYHKFESKGYPLYPEVLKAFNIALSCEQDESRFIDLMYENFGKPQYYVPAGNKGEIKQTSHTQEEQQHVKIGTKQIGSHSEKQAQLATTNIGHDRHIFAKMKGSNTGIPNFTNMSWSVLGNAATQVRTYGKEKFNELTKSSAEYICSEFKNEDICDWAMDYVHAPEGGNLTVEAWLEKYGEERLHLLSQLVSLIEGRERVFQELRVCPVCGVLDSEEGGSISASGGRIVNTSGGGEDGGWQRCGCDSCDYELNYETY